MNAKTFTVQELQTMKFYELPNAIYNLIVDELRKVFGEALDRLLPILNRANVIELDQYVNIYKYILVI